MRGEEICRNKSKLYLSTADFEIHSLVSFCDLLALKKKLVQKLTYNMTLLLCLGSKSVIAYWISKCFYSADFTRFQNHGIIKVGIYKPNPNPQPPWPRPSVPHLHSSGIPPPPPWAACAGVQLLYQVSSWAGLVGEGNCFAVCVFGAKQKRSQLTATTAEEYQQRWPQRCRK